MVFRSVRAADIYKITVTAFHAVSTKKTVLFWVILTVKAEDVSLSAETFKCIQTNLLISISTFHMLFLLCYLDF